MEPFIPLVIFSLYEGILYFNFVSGLQGGMFSFGKYTDNFFENLYFPFSGGSWESMDSEIKRPFCKADSRRDGQNSPWERKGARFGPCVNPMKERSREEAAKKGARHATAPQ